MLGRMDDDQLLEEQRRFYQARAPEYDEWWQRVGRYDRGDDDRRKWRRQVSVLDAPECAGSGTWHMRGCLRSAWLGRPIRVELQLWPRLGAWTKVSLQPRSRVHVGRLYFRKGHRALDALTARLDSELPSA